jgi:hypothetical protein
MDEPIEFRDVHRERNQLLESIAQLKYLVSLVPDPNVRTSFQSHLEHYQAKLRHLEQPTAKAKSRP